jgi:hypothetical protein
MRRANVFFLLELTAALALMLMLVVSWMALSGSSNTNQLLPSRLTTSLLIGTLVPAMALIVLIGRRLALLRAARGVLGSSGRLHVRLVWLFSLIAAIPTLLVVVFASVLFHHADIDVPGDAALALLLTTPGMHDIHHRADAASLDSNYSAGISLWDRLHGTFSDTASAAPIGIPGGGPQGFVAAVGSQRW